MRVAKLFLTLLKTFLRKNILHSYFKEQKYASFFVYFRTNRNEILHLSIILLEFNHFESFYQNSTL